MRYSEFKLLEATAQPGYYTVGDSHAEGLAAYTGKPWINKAKHSMKSTEPMHMAAINSIPKGSVVVISLGANDAMATNDSPLAIASRVASIVDASVANGNKTLFLLFPVGINKSRPERRQAVRNAIQSAISVPITDLEGQPLQSDGIHAQPNVYASVGKRLASGNKPNIAPRADAQSSNVAGKPSKEFVINVPSSRRGPDVADVQKALIALGYPLPKHGVDGVRGPETVAAVKKFQADNRLEVDGDPGPETVAKLNAILKSKPEISSKLTKSTEADVKVKPADKDSQRPGSTAVGATPDMDTLEMIKSFEGFAPKAYWDHKQWSIGYGSFAGSDRSKPDIAGPISKEQAETMLKKHVQKFSNDVERWNRAGNYKWNEGQKGALISFAYNIGSIAQLTDEGKRDNATIAKKMLAYDKASGQVVPGLSNRRRVEQQKFVMHTPELQRRS